jgi:branched-chain amino acid transport system substrate-binding protein
MMLMALAMHKAGEATGTAIAENIQSVSRPSGDGDEVVTVDEFQKAKDLIDEGTAINYQGASSPVDMNDSLEPLNRFAVLQVADDGSTETLTQIDRSEFM